MPAGVICILKAALLLACSHRVFAVPLAQFIPFGSAAGDRSLPPNNGGSSSAIPLLTRFPFFGVEHSTVFVNTNGVISFTTSVSQFTPDPFPLMGDLQLIAPFWADVDTRGTGTVWYREMTDTGSRLLAKGSNLMQSALVGKQLSFEATSLFIVTWDHVGYYDSHTDKTNTFQCVLATDGIRSFVLFYYADDLIQWTTGDASGGSGGLGGTPAQVGFNAGDGIRFASVPGSRTSEIINIASTSNVEALEAWIFQVDEGDIATGGCMIDPDATLSLVPRFGSVLGGTAILVSGPCPFEETDTISCVIDGVEVEGVFVNSTLSVCISPQLSAVGRVPFQLRIVSTSSGLTRYEGTRTFLSIATFEEGFAVSTDPSNLLVRTGDSFRVMWSTQSVVPSVDPTSYTVDITLYCLTNSELGVWTETATLASGIPNTGQAEVTVPDLSASGISEVCSGSVQVGLSGPVSEENPEDQALLQRLVQLGQLRLRAGLWSAVSYAARSAQLRFLCDRWCDSQPSGIGDQLNSQVLPCPPTREQARRDNRFSMENPLLSDVFHPNTGGCFRQVIGGGECRPGSQCCYNNAGNLIVGPPSGGTVDRFSPQGSYRCYLQHFAEDVLPAIYCCQGLFPNCDAYYRKRPSTSSVGYRLPVPACVYGDPHIVTLDGLKYTFNGKGEFTLIETGDESFTLQARMVEATDVSGNDVSATVFSAIVAKQTDSDTVQFELSQPGLDALVNGERIDLTDVPQQEFTNVIVTDNGNNTISAHFSGGAFVEVREENGIISVLLVNLPDSLQGTTRGLMGNFNGDTSDDLIPKSGGEALSVDSSLQEIHEQFGITWIIDSADDSLFTYRTGESFADFRDPTFMPRFEPTFSNPTLEAQANAICGDDLFCLFDIATTGRMEIGASTVEGSQDFDVTVNLSIPIVCDPPCENGACVANDTCNCATDFEGERCTEAVFMDCDTNPCENGGTCQIHAGSYLCQCPEGSVGSLCQTESDGDEIVLPIIISVSAGTGILILAVACLIVCLYICIHAKKSNKVHIG